MVGSRSTFEEAHRLRAVGVAVFAAVVFFAGVAGSTPAVAGGLVSSPSRFVEDYGGDVASYRGRLFVTVTGAPRKSEVRTQVFVRRGSKWRPISRQFPSTYRAGNNIHFLRFRGFKRLVPCINYMGLKDDVRFRCRMRGRWKALKVARPLRDMEFFAEASSIRGRLTAWFNTVAPPSSEGDQTKVRIGVLRGKRIVPRGPAGTFPCRCFGALGRQTMNARDGRVDLAMGALNSTRFVATLGRKGWSRSKLLPPPPASPLSVVGSQMGPVRTAHRLLMPAHTISWEAPWTFSVFGQERDGGWSQLDGRTLNVGSGNAQGAIAPVGNRVWTLWEEYPEEGTDDPTAVYAAPINRAGTGYGRTIKLWSGPAASPAASTQPGTRAARSSSTHAS